MPLPIVARISLPVLTADESNHHTICRYGNVEVTLHPDTGNKQAMRGE